MDESKKKKKNHFVLVHGACHGAWCWYKVMTWLRSEGHRVTALDLAASGADPQRPEEVTSMSDYFRPLMESMEALPPEERVVLVGHSMGGICISDAMERFPHKIGLAIFVTAYMPGPDFPLSVALQEFHRQIDSFMDSNYSFGNGDHQPPTALLFGPLFIASHLYQLSPPQDLTLASLLVRPQPLHHRSDLKEELSNQNYGSVSRAFVLCEQDNILKKRFQEWMNEKNPADEVKTISGADHMPMFSKSNELCQIMQDLATKYC